MPLDLIILSIISAVFPEQVISEYKFINIELLNMTRFQALYAGCII